MRASWRDQESGFGSASACSQDFTPSSQRTSAPVSRWYVRSMVGGTMPSPRSLSSSYAAISDL